MAKIVVGISPMPERMVEAMYGLQYPHRELKTNLGPKNGYNIAKVDTLSATCKARCFINMAKNRSFTFYVCELVIDW